MRRNASARILSQNNFINNNTTPQLAEGQRDYKRSIYINDETSLSKKERNTNFHSPYKHGKKNGAYNNPTFMSSDLFYPSSYSINNPNPATKPKPGYAPSTNDIKKKELYEQRVSMSRSHSESRIRKTEPDVRIVREQNFRQANNNEMLEKELQNLKKQPPSRAQDTSKERVRHRQTQVQTPVYLQHRREENINLNATNQRRALMEHLKQALTYKMAQEQKRRQERRAEKQMMDAENIRFQRSMALTAQKDKQRARLLSSVYNEQIRQK